MATPAPAGPSSSLPPTDDTQPPQPTTTTTTTSEQQEAAAAPAPASPPLPQRHTAQTPGPRATRFRAVLDESLAHTLGKLGWDNFAACFPTVAARSPATLRAVQRRMVDRLGALCRDEFDRVLAARAVVARLNELEALVGEAERRRDESGFEGEEDAPVP